jgi:hypothetical protein
MGRFHRLAPFALSLAPLLASSPALAHETPSAEAAEAAFLAHLEHVSKPVTCFAPGTDPAYVEALTRAHGTGHDPLLQPGFEEFSRYRLSNRWTATATDGGGLAQGQRTTLTWSYIPDGTAIPPQLQGESSNPSSLFAWLNGIYGNFNAWHPLFVQVFERWSELTGITYVYQPTDDGATMFSAGGQLGVRGDIRVGAHLIDGNSNVLAYNFFPNTGDMVLDANDSFFNNTGSGSLRMRNVLAHEHGHGLGMDHVCPVNQSKLMEPFVSTLFDGPQHDDILAGQRGYGDLFEKDLNDVSATASPLGTLATPITLEPVSIDDNGDIDWYSFSVTGATNVTAQVTPIGFTYLEGPQNANGSCTAGTNFNSLVLHDLAVSLVGTNGSTVLASANSTGVGEAESVSWELPSAGTYYVRVNGSATDNVQLYQLVVTAGLFSDGFETGNTGAWSSVGP